MRNKTVTEKSPQSKRILRSVLEGHGLFLNDLYVIALVILIHMGLFIFRVTPLNAHSSLFFTKKEMQLIRNNILQKSKSEKTLKNPECLYLSSIIYVSKVHWTIWLNHQVIHSSDSRQINGFQIEKVTPFGVDFSWIPPQSVVPLRFSLRPRQIFLEKERRVK